MIGAIIVLYNPDFELLFKGLEALLPQVDEVCIIDNSSVDNNCMFSDNRKINYIPLKKNVGIAAAQNIGVKHFIDKNFDYVVFSDQDSVVASCLIKELLSSYYSLNEKFNVATIGPMPINRKNGQPYIVKQNVKRIISINNKDYYEMHSIISSCSLMNISVFDKVGAMNEKLFIDFVDQEWCWRAKLHGYSSFLIPQIKVQHELGKSTSFMGKSISISTPFRMYFQTRNLLWLSRMEYTPSYWIKLNLKKLLVKCIYYPIFTNSRVEYLKSIIRGIIDGLKKTTL